MLPINNKFITTEHHSSPSLSSPIQHPVLEAGCRSETASQGAIKNLTLNNSNNISPKKISNIKLDPEPTSIEQTFNSETSNSEKTHGIFDIEQDFFGKESESQIDIEQRSTPIERDSNTAKTNDMFDIEQDFFGIDQDSQIDIEKRSTPIAKDSNLEKTNDIFDIEQDFSEKDFGRTIDNEQNINRKESNNNPKVLENIWARDKQTNTFKPLMQCINPDLDTIYVYDKKKNSFRQLDEQEKETIIKAWGNYLKTKNEKKEKNEKNEITQISKVSTDRAENNSNVFLDKEDNIKLNNNTKTIIKNVNSEIEKNIERTKENKQIEKEEIEKEEIQKSIKNKAIKEHRCFIEIMNSEFTKNQEISEIRFTVAVFPPLKIRKRILANSAFRDLN